MAGATWVPDAKNGASNQNATHTSITAGKHLDGTPGGNYVPINEIQAEMFRVYNPYAAVINSKIIPFIRNTSNEQLREISPKGYLHTSVVRWLSPVKAAELTACNGDITATKRQAASMTLVLDKVAGAAIDLDCVCAGGSPENSFNNDAYLVSDVDNANMANYMALQDLYDAYLRKELAKHVVALDAKYNVTAEEGVYKQIYRGLGQIKETAAKVDENGFKVGDLLTSKDLVIYVNALTEVDLNTDIQATGRRSSTEFNYDGVNLFDYMINNGTIKGFLNDVPVVFMEQSELDEIAGATGTNWVIVNNFTNAFSQACIEQGMTPSSSYNGGKVSTAKAAYIKAAYGFLNINNLYPNCISVRSVAFKTSTTS